MIVTLTGVNDFLRMRELNNMVTAFVHEHTDMAVERLDGEEASVDRMREGLQSLPFLTARKLVVLREPGKQKAFAEHIADILKDTADTTDVIIVEPKPDKRSSYYKTLQKQTDFRNYGELDANGLAKWAMQYAAEQGGNVSSSDARLLVDRLGANQQMLVGELDKLMLYNPAITRATIELLTERTPQSTVFELLDAAFAGKTKRALELYSEQRALKVEPQAIIAMLAWQLHVFAVVKAAINLSPNEIAGKARLSPFAVRKSLGVTRSITLPHLKSMVSDLLDLDMRLKRTSIDADEVLQLFLLRLGDKRQ